jgi:hypothetical protein
MRTSSVVSEAWRNLRSGTGRAATLATALACTGLVLGVTDARSVHRLAAQAYDFRARGADTWVTDAPGRVDGASCERLSEIEGVVGAGAMRDGEEPIAFASTPRSDTALVDITAGLLDVLGAGPVRSGGLVVSRDLAARYALGPGDGMDLVGLDSTVAATFPYPADGRRPGLEDAALGVVPAEGTFDECWIEVWPTDEATTSLTRIALEANGTGEVRTMQLNPTVGTGFDGATLFRSRSTRSVPAVAGLVGLALGYLSVRLRRLELASARHLGVGATPQLAQLLVESAAWAAAGAVCAAALALGALRSEDASDVASFALRPIVALAAGAVCGGGLGALVAVRERHIVRFFKER